MAEDKYVVYRHAIIFWIVERTIFLLLPREITAMKNRSWIRHLGFISERRNIDNIESRDSIERCLYWRLQIKNDKDKEG